VVSKCGKSCRLLLELVGTLHEHPDGEPPRELEEESVTNGPSATAIDS